MKILFINLPYYGHFVPTIGLVQELIKQNCEVTYLMPFDWEDKVAESGAKFYGYSNHKKCNGSFLLSVHMNPPYNMYTFIIAKKTFLI